MFKKIKKTTSFINILGKKKETNTDTNEFDAQLRSSPNDEG